MSVAAVAAWRGRGAWEARVSRAAVAAGCGRGAWVTGLSEADRFMIAGCMQFSYMKQREVCS